MPKIGEDRTDRLDLVPAQLRVIVTVRPKYACRSCTDGVTQAPAPAALIEGGLPNEEAIGHVLVSKYSSQVLGRSQTTVEHFGEHAPLAVEGGYYATPCSRPSSSEITTIRFSRSSLPIFVPPESDTR